jgi:hypothetical protein
MPVVLVVVLEGNVGVRAVDEPGPESPADRARKTSEQEEEPPAVGEMAQRVVVHGVYLRFSSDSGS